MYIGASTIFFLLAAYLLWVNYKSSPKRIINSLWNEIHANSKKIYDANEARDTEPAEQLNKENAEKGRIINSILNHYYGKASEEYNHYKYE